MFRFDPTNRPERGQLRLTPRGTDLRLVSADKTSGHVRRFLPNDDYVRMDASVLRKRDGTGFFIVAPTTSSLGSRFEVGQYRLEMAYRRNNQAVDPDSQVLSEAGVSAPEHVAIDIPWPAH